MISKNLFNIKGDDSFGISQDEIPLFLDIFPFACIVFNSNRKTILAANGLVTDLTGFSRGELVGLDVSLVIEKFPTDTIGEGKNYQGAIKVKEKLSVPISFQVLFLSKKQDIAFIKFTNEIDDNLLNGPFESKMLGSLYRINQAASTGNELEFYLSIKTEISQIFSISNADIFLFDKKENLLKNIVPDAGVFPNQIPLVEMERIQKIDYWSPGKRVLTEIHRVGRKHNFSNVVTTPLGNPQSGLVVITSRGGEFTESQRQQIELFFEWVNQFLGYIRSSIKSDEEKKRLINNNFLFMKIFELSNDCIVLVNGEYEVNTINQNALNLLGYSSYELVGHNFFEIIQNDKIKKFVDEKRENMVGEESPIFILDRTGSQIPVRMRIMKSEDVRSDEFMVVFTNMSEEIKTKKIIDRIGDQAALGEVIAEFAHEVRNPINNILTGLQLMRKKLDGDESSLEIVDRLQSDCVRMNDLMESILSFSRQDVLNFKPFNIFDLLVRIQNRFNNKFQKFNIKSNMITNADNTIVFGDIRSIDQIFTNLVNNAVDAMAEKGGELTIKIDDEIGSNNSLAISISDTGRGIPEDLRDKIFEPFISSKVTGTGLGLAITKRIIEAHDGAIKVDSFTNGTIFTVVLKLAEEE